MDKNYIKEIANTILEQLRGTVGSLTMMSWGILKIYATEFENMPALAIVVDARLFKGTVIVAYNEGIDYYELYLRYNSNDVRKVAEDLDFTQFGELIDRTIEVGENKAEYEKFCQEEGAKLFGGKFD